ncbi:major facilitator superfamily protein [Boeremia exigua]|uniref:major facilitator superfamily protein n=1 Tax=Boeremia exigua TaxID=749465 RepID=UPI001E8D4E65|nr:major facilitator superfamily protein [Boeremia exigua]KAH6625777.1 major facilitator superfamily protein [Boeremia exigua]
MSIALSTAPSFATQDTRSVYFGDSTESLGLCGKTETVTWENETDPLNPLNWTSGKKWFNVLLIVMQATLSPIASTILAIGAGEIAKEFELKSAKVPSLPTALYVLGIGSGPLFLAPFSEVFGRRVVYLSAFACFTMLNVGCALSPNIAALSTLRFLSGIAGSVGPSLSAGSVGDMFAVHERGKAQALASFGPVFGPVLGGVMGGFIVYHTTGWRWLLWTVAIAAGTVTLAGIFFLRETYAPYLLERKAAKLRKSNPDIEYRTAHSKANMSTGRILAHSLGRPVKMLFTSPILAFMAVYQSLIYGILYLHLITILLLFGPESLYGLYTYRFTSGTTGLAYLGAGSGAFIGMILTVKFMNRSFAGALARQIRRTGDTTPTPELRIPFLQIGMMIVPFGLIIFAWTAGRVHWSACLVGAFFFGIGMLMGYVCIQSYLVDCFGDYSASALAAVILARCPITFLFCFFGFELYKSLGYDWGSMLLAFLCIAMIPAPFMLKMYGPALRAKQPVY